MSHDMKADEFYVTLGTQSKKIPRDSCSVWRQNSICEGENDTSFTAFLFLHSNVDCGAEVFDLTQSSVPFTVILGDNAV